MQGKVYIQRTDDGVRYAETDEKGRLSRCLFLSDDDPTGSVYRGKVVRVTGAGAFVDIGREKNGFLSDNKKRPGDYVTVEVSRAEDGDKGCLLTEKLSLAGRYVVVTEGETRFSRKSLLGEERKKEAADIVGKGVVFRTAFNEKTFESGIAEADTLRKKLEEIKKTGEGFFIGLIYSPDMVTVAENNSDKARGDFGEIEEEIASLAQRKVVVNGVELVFDKTEAMTVIDVNSRLNAAKYKDAEACAFATDLIATEEVCRQIRLRNIGGIIAVDFVSVKSKDKIEKIKEKLSACLRCDDVMAKAEFCDKLCVALIYRTKRYSELVLG